MSRAFDSSGGADSITFSVGNAPPDQGPITVAVLAKAASVAGFTMWMARGLKSGTAIWGFLTSNNAGPKLFAENDFGNGVAGLSTSWRWYVMTKASGSAIPRIHVWDLSGAWSHTDNSANVGDGTGPIDTLVVGGNGGGSNGWRGSIAVVATWTSALSDGAIEAAMTKAALDTYNATPSWMVRLNQASTGTSVTDDMGGGGNQSAISGTSVDADDPSGYNYSLSIPSAAPNGIAVTAALGQPTVALGLTAAPSGVVLAVALGQPTVSIPSAAPTGIAVTAALGTHTVALNRTAAPSGIALTTYLGSPSTLAPSAISSGGPVVRASNRRQPVSATNRRG